MKTARHAKGEPILDVVLKVTMATTTTKTLDVPSASGGFAVREILRFAYFMRRSHRLGAQAAVQAIEQVIDLFPPPGLSMFAIESGDWLEFDATGLKAQIRERLIGDDDPINATAALSGDQANIADMALDYVGLALDRPVFRNGACMLSFHVAASALGPHLDRSLTLAARLTDLLDCHAAYVDLALVGDQKRAQAMAHRYLCMDVSDPRCVARDLEDRIPGVFWKNFLGASLVDTLGGRQVLEAALSPEAQIEPGPKGGLVLTLGAAPIRGDVNHQERFGDRVALARLAHSKQLLHVPRKIVYFEAEDSLDDGEAQEEWHLRFVRT